MICDFLRSKQIFSEYLGYAIANKIKRFKLKLVANMSKLNNSKSRIPGPNRFSSGCNMNWFWGDFWASRKSEIKYTIYRDREKRK